LSNSSLDIARPLRNNEWLYFAALDADVCLSVLESADAMQKIKAYCSGLDY